MITHLPIIGAFIGLLILVFAYLKKDANVKTAAYLVFVVNASAALPNNEQPSNELDED
jgi:predicted PurR-regulated permease PerM